MVASSNMLPEARSMHMNNTKKTHCLVASARSLESNGFIGIPRTFTKVVARLRLQTQSSRQHWVGGHWHKLVLIYIPRTQMATLHHDLVRRLTRALSLPTILVPLHSNNSLGGLVPLPCQSSNPTRAIDLRIQRLILDWRRWFDSSLHRGLLQFLDGERQQPNSTSLRTYR